MRCYNADRIPKSAALNWPHMSYPATIISNNSSWRRYSLFTIYHMVQYWVRDTMCLWTRTPYFQVTVPAAVKSHQLTPTLVHTHVQTHDYDGIMLWSYIRVPLISFVEQQIIIQFIKKYYRGGGLKSKLKSFNGRICYFCGSCTQVRMYETVSYMYSTDSKRQCFIYWLHLPIAQPLISYQLILSLPLFINPYIWDSTLLFVQYYLHCVRSNLFRSVTLCCESECWHRMICDRVYIPVSVMSASFSLQSLA